MKVIEQGNVIKITGGGFAYNLFPMIMLILVTPVGLFLSLMVLLMSAEQAIGFSEVIAFRESSIKS